MSDHLTTQELINRIESADRKYRRSSTVLLICIGIAIAATLVLQYQALEQFKSQSAERGAAIKTLQEETKKSSERTNRYLQCLARYFADPNRRDTVIQDIESCSIDQTSGALVPGVDQTPLASSGSDSVNLSPGPSGGPSISNPPENPDSSNPIETPPPRGVIPRIVDGVTGLVDDARGILGL